MKIRLEPRIVRAAVGILCIMLAAGCAPAASYLKWKQVDAGALMRSEAGMQAYNAVRFETYGPKAQQLFGYFLYKDGIEVDMGGGIPVKKLGKKTLAEVMADYNSAEKANMYSAGSMLIVREVFRADSVVGYTAADINIDVNIWDVTKGDGPTTLRVVYKDLRQEREDMQKLQQPMRKW
jgi:hypothetical protein